MKFGENIRRIRKRRGFTLRDIATKAHMSLSYLSEIERGKVFPSLRTIVKIADVFEMEPYYLLWDIDFSDVSESEAEDA